MSSVSSRFPEDPGYWEEVDRISKGYEEAILKEERFIHEHAFTVKNSLYKITTGISAARSYIPAVKISFNTPHVFTKPDNISFIKLDWDDFITYLQRFISGYFDADDDDDDDEIEDVQFSNYTIQKSFFNNIKMLKLTRDLCVFYFCVETVRNIVDVNKLVSSHMDLLEGLNFNNFYNNFLNVSNNILAESNYELPPHVTMLILCDLYPNQLQTHCMRECLVFNRNSVLNDLDRKMYFIVK